MTKDDKQTLFGFVRFCIFVVLLFVVASFVGHHGRWEGTVSSTLGLRVNRYASYTGVILAEYPEELFVVQMLPGDSTWQIVYPGAKLSFSADGFNATVENGGLEESLAKYSGRVHKVRPESIGNDAYNLGAACRTGNKSAAEDLITKGINPNAPVMVGLWIESPLYIASEKGHADIVSLLIAKGADTNRKIPEAFDNTSGDTALYIASRNGFRDVVELLLAKGAEVNVRDQFGQTPLMGASAEGHADVVKLLIANGADVNAKDGDGWTTLRYAQGHKDVIELLRKVEAK